MSMEGTPESYQSQHGGIEHPRKRIWVRLLIYAVVIGGIGFAAWRIHQNSVESAANSVKQAAALMNRPIPVQVVPRKSGPCRSS